MSCPFSLLVPIHPISYYIHNNAHNTSFLSLRVFPRATDVHLSVLVILRVLVFVRLVFLVVVGMLLLYVLLGSSHGVSSALTFIGWDPYFFLVWQVVELESGWVDRGERSLMGDGGLQRRYGVQNG